VKPFRWNLKKREQLGSLVSGSFAVGFGGYEDELAECAAKLLARSSSRRLIFVGRSPENIYDYLAGVLHNTSYENKVDILNISNRYRDPFEIRNELPAAFNALKQAFHRYQIGLRSKREFARVLSNTWEIRESWLRELVAELKRV